MNNATPGAIKAKEGDNACVLNRGSGLKKTEAAMSSSTGSQHRGGDENNKWTKVPGSGTGGNVKGYGKH